jgi:DNA-3-methyladenine glycosylase
MNVIIDRLKRPFFSLPACEVARNLLGKQLVRVLDGTRIAGIIVETEAYCDSVERDLACHGDRANDGRPTARTAVMFGPPGHAYVYFTYGMHWMFNIVTGRSGEANAVLIRAIEPTGGIDMMRALRGRPDSDLTNGPAKLAQALAIDKTVDGIDICDSSSPIWVEEGHEINVDVIKTGPRIGLGKTPEPWLSMPWRYWIEGNEYVSR